MSRCLSILLKSRRRWDPIPWIVLCGVLLPSLSGVVWGDVIRLRTGGEIRGTLRNVSAAVRSESIEMETLAGGLIVIDRDEVDFIKSRSPAMEEYITRSREIPRTVEAHWELAEWALSQRLTSMRTAQLELLLEVDPDHEQARKALGHVLFRGEWLPQIEAMARQGYFRHEGRWVTQQELDLLEKSAEQRAAEHEWFPRIRLWMSWLTSVNRRGEGLAALRDIRDPAAVPALLQNMSDHADSAVRSLLVQILGQIGGETVVKPLVARMLFDADPLIRRGALQSLTPDQYERALEHLVPELQHRENAVVRRVAVALEHIGDERTIPFLIDSLITNHTYQILIPAGTSQTFTIGPGGQPGMMAPGSNGLTPGLDLALRSGQLPYGAIILPPSGRAGPRMQAVTVSSEFRNPEVLSALETLTGENFGYHQIDWRTWWTLRRQQRQAG